MRALLKYGGLAMLLVAAMGCASKEDRSLYKRLQAQQSDLKTLQQSEKLLLSHGEGDTTIAIASYLPDDREEGEKFIVALYPEMELNSDSIRLGGAKPKAIKRLSHRALPPSLRRTIPTWFDIYSVTFPRQSVKKMVLTLRDAEGAQERAVFYKGPKYLITRPKF